MKSYSITFLLLVVLGVVLGFVIFASQPDTPSPSSQAESLLNGRWKATIPNTSELYIVMEIEDTHFTFKDPQTLEECVSGTLTIDTTQTPHRLIMFCQKSDDAVLKKLARGEFWAIGPLIDKKIYCLFQRNGDQGMIAMGWPGKEEYPPNFVESQVLQLRKIEVSP